MLATLIQWYDKKKSFHFKNERLTEILQAVRCQILWLYQFIKSVLDNKMTFFEEYGAFKLDQKWNDSLSYLRINVADIQFRDTLKKSFYFLSKSKTRDFFYRLSDATFYDRINTVYQFIKAFLDKNCLFRGIWNLLAGIYCHCKFLMFRSAASTEATILEIAN